MVAVGEHGVVLLSDDGGRHFRQAKSVPVSATLTDVSFPDALHGWAVGQWGVLLATGDGGETWHQRRIDTTGDQPFLTVYFSDAQHGWAGGIWSLLLRTDDGGRSWVSVKLPIPPGGTKADRNLFHIFGDHRGGVYIAAERGDVIRSVDGGQTWEYKKTGFTGSLWAGTSTDDGTLVVGGMLGALYRSTDHGDTWARLAVEQDGSMVDSSITDLVSAGNEVRGVGLDGVVLKGDSQSSTFAVTQRPDRASLTAVESGDSGVVFFSDSGVLRSADPLKVGVAASR
ncbi:MAG TPA: YCF48-related protein [Paraburkholderia sp.]